MSASSDRELEKQLLDAGNRLADPPSSDDQLLLLLDQVESCLSRVYQEPPKSMQDALSPSLWALVAIKLLHHPNSDIKVAVASCISEFIRITAPDGPYDDDQLKEVFQLIVASFANLSDLSSPSYAKRKWILQHMARVRSCVVMLDLELDALIVEMFKHFLNEIRDYHPSDIFSSMETIMTIVLEESEDISQELLSPILASLKNDNEEVLPIARLLGVRVLESSAAKVKPYLIQAVQSLRFPIDDYSPVVASIWEQEMSSAAEPAVRPTTPDQMAEKGLGAKEPQALDNGSGNGGSPSPSPSLVEGGRARISEFEANSVKFKVEALDTKLGKCKIELEENQKMSDGLKCIVIVVIVFALVLYGFS